MESMPAACGNNDHLAGLDAVHLFIRGHRHLALERDDDLHRGMEVLLIIVRLVHAPDADGGILRVGDEFMLTLGDAEAGSKQVLLLRADNRLVLHAFLLRLGANCVDRNPLALYLYPTTERAYIQANSAFHTANSDYFFRQKRRAFPPLRGRERRLL